MKIVNMRSEVKNISRKTPCVIEVPTPRVIDTLGGPGKITDTIPAAAIPAAICAMKQRRARIRVRAPTRKRPSVTRYCWLGSYVHIPRITKSTGQHTAGLNRPPDTLKNTHTLTIKLNPKSSAINNNTFEFGACVILPFSYPADPGSLYVADAKFGSIGLSRSSNVKASYW